MVNTVSVGKSLCTNATKQQSPISLPEPSGAVNTSSSTDLLFYYRTSRCNINKSRHHIILDYDKLPSKSGFLTPVQCTGDLLVKRLIDAGISISSS